MNISGMFLFSVVFGAVFEPQFTMKLLGGLVYGVHHLTQAVMAWSNSVAVS